MNKHMDLLANLKTMVETRKISGAAMLSLDSYNERSQVCQRWRGREEKRWRKGWEREGRERAEREGDGMGLGGPVSN